MKKAAKEFQKKFEILLKKLTKWIVEQYHTFTSGIRDKMTREYPWCKVVICDKHYTSKICGNCGYLHQKLGSNKTFKCPQCQIEMDRDINAARNILLRYLTLNMCQIEKFWRWVSPLPSGCMT
ncbi:hypothetical protein Glove_396g67 [Diversispora epigaea]|uniref:Cas12f1-like TNB domain-containing protein n=1 Tax=Diversispora epigaea TaxID=1348612 RepID=A0A397H1G1_9GLOM|nr:hypothetical protein Glove_396g67 [Diversispora epigaea]